MRTLLPHWPSAIGPTARHAMCAVALVVVGLAGSYGDSLGQETPDGPTTFRSGTTVVLLTVSVHDADGHPVRGLTAADVVVLEDGRPQPITDFRAQPDHVAVALVVDTSSSMRGPRLTQTQHAAAAFLASSRPTTRFAFVSFDQAVTVHHAFGASPVHVRAAIDRLHARGGTALYDAIAQSLTLATTISAAQVALVLLSDGQDQDSRTPFVDVRQQARTSPATIYAIGYYTAEERRRFLAAGQYFKRPAVAVNLNPAWVLSALSGVSGGQAFFPPPEGDLSPIFEAIRRDVQHRYVLGYVATPDRHGPRLREIRVHVSRDGVGAGPVVVRTRHGVVY